MDRPLLNDEIRIQECRLATEGEEQYGVVSMERARQLSYETGLDLILIAPTANPPVVKLMDYGKYKYIQQKKVQEAKKKQVVIQLKEIQFRPNIETHDLGVKLKKINQFIIEGDKVKMVMQFRGREMAYMDQGMVKFHDIITKVIEFGGLIESEPKKLGNRIITIVAPDKKKIGELQKLKETKSEVL
ncbi:MAG: translation initiation factor IF-3 [Bdellovibrionales bacterium RIFOXYA1_FULL_36_14]|nr:MAG: translation initiation factor IF-3 [Bdellovibrionales bacterium RIFOXYA1_FULL_36_14]